MANLNRKRENFRQESRKKEKVAKKEKWKRGSSIVGERAKKTEIKRARKVANSHLCERRWN